MSDKPSGLSRREARALEGARDRLELGGSGILDTIGPAIYELEPAGRSVLLCLDCRYVSLMLGLPVRPTTWTCPRCHRAYPLRPPLGVMIAAGRGLDRVAEAVRRN